MTYRIAFSGASGTGKTTLMNAVNETLGLPVNPVGSRSVAKDMGFESPYDVDKAGKREEFQRRLLKEKFEWERDHQKSGFITDRTAMDNIAYSALHAVDTLQSCDLALAVTNCKLYTHVFYLPWHWSCTSNDPSRREDPTYHMIFSHLLEGLLTKEVFLRDAESVYEFRDGPRVLRKLDLYGPKSGRNPTTLLNLLNLT